MHNPLVQGRILGIPQAAAAAAVSVKAFIQFFSTNSFPVANKLAGLNAEHAGWAGMKDARMGAFNHGMAYERNPLARSSRRHGMSRQM